MTVQYSSTRFYTLCTAIVMVNVLIYVIWNTIIIFSWTLFLDTSHSVSAVSSAISAVYPSPSLDEPRRFSTLKELTFVTSFEDIRKQLPKIELGLFFEVHIQIISMQNNQ